MWFQQTEHCLEQCCFSTAIRTEQCQRLTWRNGESDVSADRLTWIAEAEAFSRQRHDQLLRADTSSQMNTGVPITAVRIPSGISTCAALRASVSISNR